jgi:ABC-type uncharacterized transport system substrate-binding protein
VALQAGRAGAAEVALLKSSDVPAWRPVIDAVRRTASAHAVTDFDLRADRREGERVAAALRPRRPIVVAMGPLAAQVAKDVMPESPLVYCLVQDPVRLGLPAAAAGVAFYIPVKNQFAAFRLVYPRGVRIGVIYGDPAAARLVEEAQAAAGVVRVILVPRSVTTPDGVSDALKELFKGDDAVDALWVPPDPLLLGEETRRLLLAESARAKKPVYAFSTALVAEGALVSSGPDLVSVGEQVGELVNRIAGGDASARGALQMPRAEIAINKRTAEKMKIDIPADALAAASKVF